MRGLSYEPTPDSFSAWIATARECVMVDLYTITQATGTVLRYSSSDVALTVPGVALFGLGPGFKRGNIKQSVGLSVDTLKLTVYADAGTTLGGIHYMTAIKNGAWVNATLLLETAYLDTSLTIRGVVPKFSGLIGAASVTRTEAQMDVRSAADALSVMVPGEVYQTGCRNTFGDGLCGLVVSGLQVAGTASASQDASRRMISVTASGAIASSGWASLGQITMTSGLNAGASRGVAVHTADSPTAHRLTLFRAFDNPVAPGDACTIIPGCAKTMAACNSFGNIARFRGEPFIPAPETIL